MREREKEKGKGEKGKRNVVAVCRHEVDLHQKQDQDEEDGHDQDGRHTLQHIVQGDFVFNMRGEGRPEAQSAYEKSNTS